MGSDEPRKLGADEWAAFADRLMMAGDRLAEQLRNPNARPDSPWTVQILGEWSDMKDLVAWI